MAIPVPVSYFYIDEDPRGPIYWDLSDKAKLDALFTKESIREWVDKVDPGLFLIKKNINIDLPWFKACKQLETEESKSKIAERIGEVYEHMPQFTKLGSVVKGLAMNGKDPHPFMENLKLAFTHPHQFRLAHRDAKDTELIDAALLNLNTMPDAFYLMLLVDLRNKIANETGASPWPAGS